jgi:hypothetical protein
MPVETRYRISDLDIEEIRSFRSLRQIPDLLTPHKKRLSSIGDLVLVVSNRAHAHPTFVHLNAFHRHQTPYAAIDALAPALATFFERTEILPIVNPIFDRYEMILSDLDPRLYETFMKRGILIPRELRE